MTMLIVTHELGFMPKFETDGLYDGRIIEEGTKYTSSSKTDRLRLFHVDITSLKENINNHSVNTEIFKSW